MSGYPKYDTELIIAAIEGTGGVAKDIAEKLGVHRVTVWKWAQKNEEIATAIEEEKESTLDLAESRLLKLIRSEKDEVAEPAVRYFLGTRGKHRGYTKKIEMAGNLQHSGQILVYLPDNGRGGSGGS